jgi:hypothetical protein
MNLTWVHCIDEELDAAVHTSALGNGSLTRSRP